jgi:uncharacterized protein
MEVRIVKLYIGLILLLSAGSVSAQAPAAISVKANVNENTIQLRWVVNTAMAWKQSNKYGVKVERYTVVRNGEMLAQPEKVLLTPTALKPQPLNNWEKLATSNNYAAVIAQALYGHHFNMTDQHGKGISQVIALAQEQEQRYLVSMYAADMCYPAALLAGWGIEDNTVKKGERYLYRIIPAVPEKVLKIATGSVYIGLADVAKLPKPQELAGVFGDETVLLTWNYGVLSTVYNAYYIEKSYDGTNFKRLTDIPLTNMNSHNGKPVDRMFYTDSLRDNNSKAYYRVVGITSFSEEGPVSAVIEGKGTTRLIYVPHITRSVPDDKGVLTVDWEFDERGDAQIDHFELQRSDDAKGPFTRVGGKLAPGSRTTTYDSLQASNYLVIAAVPHDGEPTLSFPVLVQPTDTVPPAPPEALIGLVDTLGVVRLSWKANTEKDIYGYRIYRAQTQGEEMIPLTDVAVLKNEYVDTVNVRNLNTKVYYAVTALDQRYNQSDKSEVATLQKPELVPPSTPVIIDYKLTNRAVVLEWACGQEENLGEVRLFRREQGQEQTLLASFTDFTKTIYKDSTVQADRYYSYSMVSVTGGGLKSAISPVVTVQAPALSGEQGKITELVGKFDRKSQQVELRWKQNVPDIKQVEIYRSENGQGFMLLKVLKGFELSMSDAQVKPGASYEYMIRAILLNGRNGSIVKTTVGVK